MAGIPATGSEAAMTNWPSPNTGTTLYANDTPWSGYWVPIYYFTGYAYAGQGRVPITWNPDAGRKGMMSCESHPEYYMADFGGVLGINQDGYRAEYEEPPRNAPCCLDDICTYETEHDCNEAGGEWHPEASSCTSTLCITPLAEVSWGRIKALYFGADEK